MLQFVQGDILKQDAEALVNTVNCVGVMGRGIALQFRKAFPENYEAYVTACKRNEVQLGKMFVYDTGSFHNPRYIINFPTKRHWKGKSHIEDIYSGLESLVKEINIRNIKSIAIPPLGAGLGGLEWPVVRQAIVQAFANMPGIEVYIFEPVGAPDAEHMVKSAKIPEMTMGRAALIGLMRRYLAAVMDPTVTLLELQKMMYFMQEAGQPLRLDYQKGLYGPYAWNLRHVLKEIEGHYVSGYLDGGDDPKKPLELKSGASAAAEAVLDQHMETRERFARVADLIEGFETPFGMELLATTHWVVTQEGAGTSQEVIEKFHEWNQRKKMFSAKQIQVALGVLHEKAWIDVAH